jgi:hypothetical protein
MNRHTVNQLSPAVGTRVGVRFESLVIPCQVLDAKAVWGEVRLLVTPVGGSGEQWVTLGRLVRPYPATQDLQNMKNQGNS